MLLSLLSVVGLVNFVCGLGQITCQTVAPAQQNLSYVRTAQLSVSGSPFGIAYASNQPDVAFVALTYGAGNSSLGVLNTTTFPPSLQSQILIPTRYSGNEGPFGVALTHNGQYLIVADGLGALVFDTSKAAVGDTNAIVGFLNGTTSTQFAGDSAIEVTISQDDNYVFVSQEYGYQSGSSSNSAVPGNIDVFTFNNGTGNPVRFHNLGYAVVGSALSPDGNTLYATSEQSSVDEQQGSITAINITSLEQPFDAVSSTNAYAGCAPVRVLVSSDGDTVWVTARQSNQLLAFDAEKLSSDPDNALITSVQVGTSPVGLTFVNNGTMIITADSNRFNYANATTGLTVIDVQAALAGKPAVLGRIATGRFPREFATSPDGKTLLVSDFVSKQIQAVDITTLMSDSSNGTTGNGTVGNGTTGNASPGNSTQSNGTQSTGSTSEAVFMRRSSGSTFCIAVTMLLLFNTL